MAGGHVAANQANTWPLRPTPQSEDAPCRTRSRPHMAHHGSRLPGNMVFLIASNSVICQVPTIGTGIFGWLVWCPHLPGAISRELFDARVLFAAASAVTILIAARIDLSRRSGLFLVPTRKRLGLSGPLPFLELRTMYGDRIRHLLILRDQPALRPCVPAAGDWRGPAEPKTLR